MGTPASRQRDLDGGERGEEDQAEQQTQPPEVPAGEVAGAEVDGRGSGGEGREDAHQPQRVTEQQRELVDGQAGNADDTGPGTPEHPFKTIRPAAQVLQPGERVVIAAGVYRECVRPARGGTGPDAMISYEAAPGAQVIIKGSAVVTGWKPSEGWNLGVDPKTKEPVAAWELRLDPKLFPDGYNPFEVDNVIGNRYWINYAKDNMATYFRRRGLVVCIASN